MDVGEVREKSRDALEASHRAGLVAYGLLHLLIAWLTVELAFGNGHSNPSRRGALQELASAPLGRTLVWAVAIAMAAFTVQRLFQSWVDDEWKDRLKHWGKAIVYAAVSFSAVEVASRSGGGGTQKQRTLSARVMDVPGGTVLVVVVGFAIIGFGLFLCYRGLSRDFRDKLASDGKRGDAGKLYLAFGQAGYTAKGLVIALIGVLVAYAGFTHDPHKTGGLDQALQTLQDQPFGVYLLCAAAAGIACYGLFCFAQARYLAPDSS